MSAAVGCDIEDFRAAAAAGRWKGGAVMRTAPSQPTVSPAGGRRIRFVFSDESVDLLGDVISAKGWKLAEFMQNPIALFGHDGSRPENVIGRAHDVGAKGKQLLGDIEFAGPDINPTADMVFRLYKGGFMKAVSVGFEPMEFTLSKGPGRPGGVDFQSQRLLEISAVPIPCNSNALAVARSAGINTAPLVRWSESLLDKGTSAGAGRARIERIRKAAGAPAVHQVRAIERRDVPAAIVAAIEADARKRLRQEQYHRARESGADWSLAQRLIGER